MSDIFNVIVSKYVDVENIKEGNDLFGVCGN